MSQQTDNGYIIEFKTDETVEFKINVKEDVKNLQGKIFKASDSTSQDKMPWKVEQDDRVGMNIEGYKKILLHDSKKSDMN